MIIDLYVDDSYMTLSALARHMSCSRGAIRNVLEAHNIPIRSKAEAQQKRPDIITDRDESRFWKKVINIGKDECWKWVGSKNSCGYGRMQFNGVLEGAHRVSWMIHTDTIPLPKGVHVLHSCDNPECCNPAHLWLGNHKDNMKDRNKKGRTRGGRNVRETSPSARFSERDVLRIRE